MNYKIRGSWTLTYPIFYQVRFVLIAISATFLFKYLVLQVLAVILSSILITAVLGSAHPFKIVRKNYKEIVNESVIIIIMDLLLFSSDPSVDPENRAFIGFAMIGILGLSLLVNQSALVVETIRNFKLSCKRCIVRRRKSKRKAMQRRSVDQLIRNTGSLVAQFTKDNNKIEDDASGAAEFEMVY